jgi:hypothetical protein
MTDVRVVAAVTLSDWRRPLTGLSGRPECGSGEMPSGVELFVRAFDCGAEDARVGGAP